MSSTQQGLIGGEPLAACQWPSVGWLGDTCTAVLVHPRVLLYAAHCGDAFDHVTLPEGDLPIARCERYPNASIYGTDLAVCVLERAASAAPIAAVVQPCEADAVAATGHGIVVGYGSSEDAGPGSKRYADVAFSAREDELVVDDPGFGSCDGDSGGPLFVSIADGDASAWRLAGVLSSGSRDDCGVSKTYFSQVGPHLSWLEEHTGFDITPCGDAEGGWSPSAGCDSFDVDPADANCAPPATRPSMTCGAAYSPPATPGAAASAPAACSSMPGRRARDSAWIGLILALCICLHKKHRLARRMSRSAVALRLSQ